MKRIALAALLSAAAFWSAPSQASVIQTGLIGWWKGDGNANDSSTTPNNGTFSGSYAAGNIGQAFDLSTGNVNIPDNAAYSFGSDFSAGFWFNGTGGGTYIGQDNGGGNQPKWFIDYGYQNAGKFEIHLNGSGSVFLPSDAVSPAAGWNQFTLTKSGSTYSFYLNGTGIGSQTYAGAFPDPTADLVFGLQEAGVAKFTGLLDDIVLYNRALSASEVQELASTSAVPLPPALLLFATGLAGLGWFARRRRKSVI